MVMELEESGNPAGKPLSRNKIHRLQLWHAAVHIWIVNEKGELLIQKRSAEKSQYANVWHISAAGHIGVGEKPLATAAREASEELGLGINESDFKFVCRTKVKQVVPETGLEDKEWLSVYLLKIDSGMDFKLQGEEVKAVRWISLDQLAADIKDVVKSKAYLNHPASHYLDTIAKIRQLI
jgi:isopentenyldiphosphate isomerase